MLIRTSQEIFYYEGLIDSLTVVEILSDIEASAEAKGMNSLLRKKIFNIAVEGLQNLYHHTRDFSIPGKSDKEIRQVQFALLEDADYFYIETRNLLTPNQRKIVEEKINFVNQLSKEKLKELHRKVLTNNEISGKGGAGLGFIDMRRKSGLDLAFRFESIDDDLLRFIFIVKIIKQKEKE